MLSATKGKSVSWNGGGARRRRGSSSSSGGGRARDENENENEIENEQWQQRRNSSRSSDGDDDSPSSSSSSSSSEDEDERIGCCGLRRCSKAAAAAAAAKRAAASAAKKREAAAAKNGGQEEKKNSPPPSAAARRRRRLLRHLLSLALPLSISACLAASAAAVRAARPQASVAGFGVWRRLALAALTGPDFLLVAFLFRLTARAARAPSASVAARGLSYYLMGVRKWFERLLRVGVAAGAFALLFPAGGDGSSGSESTAVATRKAGFSLAACAVILCSASAGVALGTKLLAGSVYARAHFDRMRDALRRETILVALSSPRPAKEKSGASPPFPPPSASSPPRSSALAIAAGGWRLARVANSAVRVGGRGGRGGGGGGERGGGAAAAAASPSSSPPEGAAAASSSPPFSAADAAGASAPLLAESENNSSSSSSERLLPERSAGSLGTLAAPGGPRSWDFATSSSPFSSSSERPQSLEVERSCVSACAAISGSRAEAAAESAAAIGGEAGEEEEEEEESGSSEDDKSDESNEENREGEGEKGSRRFRCLGLGLLRRRASEDCEQRSKPNEARKRSKRGEIGANRGRRRRDWASSGGDGMVSAVATPCRPFARAQAAATLADLAELVSEPKKKEEEEAKEDGREEEGREKEREGAPGGGEERGAGAEEGESPPELPQLPPEGGGASASADPAFLEKLHRLERHIRSGKLRLTFADELGRAAAAAAADAAAAGGGSGGTVAASSSSSFSSCFFFLRSFSDRRGLQLVGQVRQGEDTGPKARVLPLLERQRGRDAVSFSFFCLLFERKNPTSTSTLSPQNQIKKLETLSTHVEREDLDAFFPKGASPGAADAAMSLLDVDGDGR